MRIGYARVSTDKQVDLRQEDALRSAGCERIFSDVASGAKSSCPQLDKMLDQLRPGDRVVVLGLDRISRSTKHLIELSDKFDSMGVDFVSLHERIDTKTPGGRFFYKLLASLAELERDIIRERTLEGLSSARSRGRKGGRRPTDPASLEKALRLYESNSFTVSEVTQMTGVSRSVLYRDIAKCKTVRAGQEVVVK